MASKKFKSLSLVSFVSSLALASNAAVIVSDSFDYTSGNNLSGQSGGKGFNGGWTEGNTAAGNAPASAWTVGTGLSMSGVASSGNGAMFNIPAFNVASTVTNYATREFTSALPTSTIYGSFLFSINTADNQSSAQSGLLLGSATENAGTASFYISPDGFNSQASVIRAEGSNQFGSVAAAATTYLYLYQANATTGNIQAWILNAAQLANFSGSLDAATLNAATQGTGDTNVFSKGSTTAATPPVGGMDAARLLAYVTNSSGPNGYNTSFDEFRISDTSLLEAVTAVPEPSSMVFLGLFGGMALLRRKRA